MIDGRKLPVHGKRCVIDMWSKLWPTWLCALVVFLLPWQTRYIFGAVVVAGHESAFTTVSVYALELVALGLLPVIPWRDRNVWAAGGALLAVAISAWGAFDGVLALERGVHLIFAAIVFCALLSPRVDVRVVMTAFILGLVPAVFLGVWQVVMGSMGSSTWLGLAARNAESLGDAVVVLNERRVLRAHGSFPHPNIFAGAMTIGTLFLLRVSLRWRMVLFLILGVGIVLTGSRAAIVALLCAGIVFAIHRWCVSGKGLGIAGAALIAPLVLFVSLRLPDIAARLRGGGALEMNALTERAMQWADIGHMVTFAQVWTGVGYANYVLALPAIDATRAWWLYQPIHNVPALLFAETGLLGVIMVCVLIARVVRGTSGFGWSLVLALWTLGTFDHYLWTEWSGLALCAVTLAMVARDRYAH